MPPVRVRQHVNPLSQKYQAPVEPPDWDKIFAVSDQPLHLDIGCGRGFFLDGMAQAQPDWNFLGLEIREPLVEQANQRRKELGLANLSFLFCNANTSLRPLLSSLPPGGLHRVSVQFPDPWFKKRHQKRRVVQLEMVKDIASFLVSGGTVFIQSDVEAVAAEMRDRFQEHPDLMLQGDGGWLESNPLPAQTEREQFTLAQGKPVYRAFFVRR